MGMSRDETWDGRAPTPESLRLVAASALEALYHKHSWSCPVVQAGLAEDEDDVE